VEPSYWNKGRIKYNRPRINLKSYDKISPFVKKTIKRVYLKIEIIVKQILIQIQRQIVVQIQKLKHFQIQNQKLNLYPI